MPGAETMGARQRLAGLEVKVLAAAAAAFFAMVAMTAIDGRGRAGLPDIVSARHAPPRACFALSAAWRVPPTRCWTQQG